MTKFFDQPIIPVAAIERAEDAVHRIPDDTHDEVLVPLPLIITLILELSAVNLSLSQRLEYVVKVAISVAVIMFPTTAVSANAGAVPI